VVEQRPIQLPLGDFAGEAEEVEDVRVLGQFLGQLGQLCPQPGREARGADRRDDESGS
jgi:hypothetical protein